LIGNPAVLHDMRTNAHDAWRRQYRSTEIYARFVDHLMTMTAAACAA
jgi:hypothetical protein